MKVAKLLLRNVMGIEELEIRPGKFTRIKAPNGAGKTSIAKGLESLFNGNAESAKLLRNGASEGEIVMLLDDGTEATKKFSDLGVKFSLKDPNGKAVRSATVATWNALINKASANPVAFFQAKKEDRKKLLLKSMPMEADPARLTEIMGQPVALTGSAWDVLATLRKQVYDARTETNRAAEGKRNTVAQLKAAMPQEEVSEDPEFIRIELESVSLERDKKMVAIQNQWDTVVIPEHDRMKQESTQMFRSEREQIEAQIKSLTARLNEINLEEARAMQSAETYLADMKSRADNARIACTGKYNTDKAVLDARLKAAELAIEARGRMKQNLSLIESMTAEAIGLEETSVSQTNKIDSLDAYKVELMRLLPVAGLTIEGDNILCDGVEFDFLNEAKRMEIAVEISLMQAGEAKFLFVDGAESLDAKNFELLKQKVIAADAQCLVMEVNRELDATGFKVEDLA